MIINIIRVGAFLLGSAALAGCSINPRFDTRYDTNGVPTVSDIVKRIYCELIDAATDYKQLRSEDVAASLSLQVQGTDGTSPMNTVNPFPSLSLAVTGNLSRQRTNLFTETVQYSMGDLWKDYSSGHATIDCATNRPDVADELNIRQTVASAFGSVDPDTLGFAMPKVTKTASGGSFSSRSTFVVTASLNPLKATWVLSAVSYPNTLQFSEVYTDYVELDFAPHDVKVPVTKVYITGSAISLGGPSHLSQPGGEGTKAKGQPSSINPLLEDQINRFNLLSLPSLNN